MKSFQVQLLKKTHLSFDFAKTLESSTIVFFLQLPNLSILEKKRIQKEVLAQGFRLQKLEDKLTKTYFQIGLNTNNTYMIYNSHSNKLIEEEFTIYSNLMKLLAWLKKTINPLLLLGINYCNQFTVFGIDLFPMDIHLDTQENVYHSSKQGTTYQLDNTFGKYFNLNIHMTETISLIERKGLEEK